MTRLEIAVQLCKRIPEMQRSTAVLAVGEVINIISDALVAGDTIALRDFGSLEIRRIPERPARNISTGEKIIVPPHRTVKFKISGQLKKRLNNGTVD